MKYLFFIFFTGTIFTQNVFACTPPFSDTNQANLEPVTKNVQFFKIVTESFGPDCRNHPLPFWFWGFEIGHIYIPAAALVFLVVFLVVYKYYKKVSKNR